VYALNHINTHSYILACPGGRVAVASHV
jgi:hypothetical protein